MNHKLISNSYLKNYYKNSFKVKRRKPKYNKLKYFFIYKKLIIIIIIIIIGLISSFIFFKHFNKLFFKKKVHLKPNLQRKKEKIDYNNLTIILEKYKRKDIIWPIRPYLKFNPVLSFNELRAFSYFMNPKNIYFEFGSGGSTNVASFYNLTVYSVESDKMWHYKLKNSGINANYITIDLKSNGNFGNPGKETTVEDWKKYIQAYKSEYNADIILIDGRFRVACALDIFPKIRNDTIVLIHDYVRKEYHIVENYYIKIKRWDNLASFVKKPNIDSIPKSIYNKYIYIPR